MKIELKNISLKIQNHLIFQNLNLSFEGPGIIGIVGPSGCGKSTLLRILAGLQRPTSGVMIKPDLKQGFVFQESHLLNWRTSFENVALPLELQKKSDSKAVERALKNVSMWEARDLVPSQLSGGMKMRVSLARAFVSNPDFLFCDEPFSALDELTRESLQKFLRQEIMLHRKLCFFVTHSLTEALNISDHIYYFKQKGEISAEVLSVKHNNAAQAEQLEWLKSRLTGVFK